MAFNRFTKNVLNVSALPDRVQNQANMLKATFDQAGVDNKEALNTLMDELEANTSAGNIGAKNTQGGTSTVQSELTLLNTNLGNKVDKVSGKQLSTEDYTTDEKLKLAGIENGANKYVLPEASTTQLGGIKVDGSTIVVENGVAKAKAADAADYTAREEIAKLAEEVGELKETNVTKSYFTATIPTTGWSSESPYTIELSVTGMLESDSNFTASPMYNISNSDTILEAWSKVTLIESATDKIKVYCKNELPTVEIPIQITVVR